MYCTSNESFFNKIKIQEQIKKTICRMQTYEPKCRMRNKGTGDVRTNVVTIDNTENVKVPV